MSKKRKTLHDRLDATMNKGVERFIGFQVDGEWRGIAVPHHVFIASIAKHLPEYLSFAPDLHDQRKILSWTCSKVKVSEKVKLQRVQSKKGFITMQPHLVIDRKDNYSTDDKYNHELETDNMPRVALRLSDSTIVAEDSGHYVAVSMSKTFDYLKDKMHTEDIRILVSRVIRRLGGIKKLKDASTWYVPWTKEAEKVLEALKEIVADCRPYSWDKDSAYLYVTKMPRSEKDDVIIAQRSAKKTFASEYRGIFADIESFIEGMFSGKSMQDSALKERLKKSRFLRERTELYQEILDIRSENMKAALELIEDATECLIEGAGEYRVSMKESKKCSDNEREKYEDEARSHLERWAKESEKIMKRCRIILDPGTNNEEEKEEEEAA